MRYNPLFTFIDVGFNISQKIVWRERGQERNCSQWGWHLNLLIVAVSQLVLRDSLLVVWVVDCSSDCRDTSSGLCRKGRRYWRHFICNSFIVGMCGGFLSLMPTVCSSLTERQPLRWLHGQHAVTTLFHEVLPPLFLGTTWSIDSLVVGNRLPQY